MSGMDSLRVSTDGLTRASSRLPPPVSGTGLPGRDEFTETNHRAFTCEPCCRNAPPHRPRLKRKPLARPERRGATIEAMMTGSVDTISKGRDWRQLAARYRCMQGLRSRRSWLAWWRGGGAGRPGWSRTLHDRKAERRCGAVGHGFTASECGRSNPRFEPTPHHGTDGPGCEVAVHSMKPVAVRSPILSRVIAELRPAARGSSARRSA